MEGKSDRRADTDLKSAGSVMNGMGSNPSSSAKYGSRGGNGIHARLWL